MDLLGNPPTPPSPVVKLQYRGAVYDNSIRILPGTDNNQLYDAARNIASFPPSTPISLLRLDRHGELVTNPEHLNDGELLEVMEGTPDDGSCISGAATAALLPYFSFLFLTLGILFVGMRQ